MENLNNLPNSLHSAAKRLRTAFSCSHKDLSTPSFLRAWFALSYLFPSLHPDSHDEPDGGWPRVLKPLAAEAWRRFEAGEITEDELYPSEATWAGIYDRMSSHTGEETARRRALAAG